MAIMMLSSCGSGGSNEVTSESNEVTSGSDEVTSGSDEVTSGSDEVTSGSDEVTSGSNEVTSGSDEVTSGLNEVTIGEQVWMTQNLNVAKFRNGDPIPRAITAEQWREAARNRQPAWCYYENDWDYGKSMVSYTMGMQ